MMRRAGATAAFALAAAVLAVAASVPWPGQRGVNAAAEDRLPVVRLESKTGRQCTATLVAPDRAVTAAHCLQAEDGTFLAPEAIRVVAPWPGAGGPLPAGGLYPARGFAEAAGDGAAGGRPARDWALVVLAQGFDGAPPPARLAPRRDAAPDGGATGFLLAAFADRDGPSHVLRRQGNCRVEGQGDGLWQHSCDGPPGASGAPLLRRRGGAWHVAAMHIGRMHRAGQDEPASVAVQLPAGLAEAQLSRRARTR